MAMFKVTRVWYVKADKATEAIEKTRNFNHDEVSSRKVYNRRVIDLRKDAQSEDFCSRID